MTTTASPVNARVIGLAHYAARALLEGLLARHGATFNQSVALRAAVAAGGTIGVDALITEVNSSLKTDDSVVRGVIEELTAAKLLEADPADPSDPAEASRVRLTEAGRELHDLAVTGAAEIAARLYAGIPDEDLAVAGRVLALITERANAELAAA